jgi:hypothetical protein
MKLAVILIIVLAVVLAVCIYFFVPIDTATVSHVSQHVRPHRIIVNAHHPVKPRGSTGMSHALHLRHLRHLAHLHAEHLRHLRHLAVERCKVSGE